MFVLSLLSVVKSMKHNTLNTLTTSRKATATRESLIDYQVCRVVVPGALVGTYLGVILNSIVPGWALTLRSYLLSPLGEVLKPDETRPYCWLWLASSLPSLT